MMDKNQTDKNQPEQKPVEPPITPAKPVELTDEELGQVVGGIILQRPSAPPNGIEFF